MRQSKKINTMLALCLAVTGLTAQRNYESEETFTTVFKQPPSVRVVFRVGTQASMIDRDPGFMFRGSVGLLLDRKFFIGVEGNSLVNTYYTRDAAYVPVLNETAYWDFNYGGVRMNYMFRLPNGFEIGAGTLVGGGSVEREFECNSLSKKSPEYSKFDPRLDNEGRFFVLEPNIVFGMNLTRVLKVELNGAYRMVSGTRNYNTVGMSDQKFSGFSGGATLQLSLGRPGRPAPLPDPAEH